jgi:hypothetical protein
MVSFFPTTTSSDNLLTKAADLARRIGRPDSAEYIYKELNNGRLWPVKNIEFPKETNPAKNRT